MCVFQDGSRKSSRCKRGLGDRNFGGVLRYADGHAVSGKKKKGLARGLQSQTLSQNGTIHHIREWKKDEEGKEGKDEEGNSTTVLVLLTNVVIVRSVLSCLLQRPPRVAAVAVFIQVLPADNANGTWCGFALAAF